MQEFTVQQIIVLSLIAFSAPLAYVYWKKRKEDFIKTAQQLNLNYSYKNFGGRIFSKRQFSLLRSFFPFNLTITHDFFTGKYSGNNICVFQMVKGDGRSIESRQTVIYLKSSATELPEFILKPEKSHHKLAARFGFKDINLKSHSYFSKSFYLAGKDKISIRALFSSAVISKIESENGLSIESRGNSLIIFKENFSVTESSEILKLMEWALTTLSQFKA